MWVIGHTAFAYLLIKPLFIFTKKKVEPRLIFFIFIFANLIDSVHYGPLRRIFHNPIGTIIFAVFWLIFFEKCKIIHKTEFPLLLFATGTHVLADVIFSSYFLLFPLNTNSYSIYGWNSSENLIVGAIMVMAFLLIFFLSGDYRRLKDFISEEKTQWRRNFTFKELFNPSWFTLYLFIAFYLFTLAQFLVFLRLWSNLVLMSVWYVWLFCMVFLSFSFVLTMIVFG